MRIAVVGGCGSGKSTIVKALSERGYDAYVVGQEHSGVSKLWAKRHPDVLVYLDVTLDAVRERRDSNWPEWLFRAQRERLRDARESASIRMNTAHSTESESINGIVDYLNRLEMGQDSSSA